MLFDLGYPPHQSAHARLGERGTSLQELHQQFPDEAACLRHVFAVRYGPEPPCPQCGPTAAWRARPSHRHMIHSKCRSTVRPYQDTIFEQSNWPIRYWLYAMLHLANSKTSIDGNFLSRELGIQAVTARRMLTRIRLHLAAIDHVPLVGHPGGMVHVRLERPRGIYMPGVARRKLPQLLCMAVGRTVRSVVTDISRPHRLRRLIATRTDPAARVFTDCHRTIRLVSNYRPYDRMSFDPGYFYRDGAEQDAIHGFMASFVRGVAVQHRHIAMPSAWLFLKEYEFRFNRRHRSQETFQDMLSAFPSMRASHTRMLQAWNNDLGA